MLIGLYFFVTNIVLPKLGGYLQASIKPVMVILITLAGIVMIFGAVGMRISENLGSTVVGGFFKAIGYVGRSIIQGIGWLIKNIIKLIPKVFDRTRWAFNQLGFQAEISNVLAVLITFIFIVIII